MSEAYETITIPLIQQRKREGKKSIGVVAWDFPTTRMADRAGVDFIVVGDSVDKRPLPLCRELVLGQV
jgi:3-methyl-2-oxobutanoate hydroxymethyltransferase